MTTRGQFIKGLAAATFLPAALGGCEVVSGRPGEERPNVLFVLTDDQAPHTVYEMPKTLDLFSGGVDLTKTAYVTIPVCGPARASLLTGRYAHNHGITENETTYARYTARGYAQNDLLSRLGAAGYGVGVFGKFLNGFEDGNDWQHPACTREAGGRWVVFAGRNHKVPYTLNVNGRIREENRNQNLLLGDYAENWIRQKAASEEPFFCYLPVGDPHAPFRPTRGHAHDLDGAVYSSPATEEDTPEELADKSRWARERATAGPAHQQEFYEGQLEELRDVDDLVERMANALSELGVLENTLIVFATDNGYALGEHGGTVSKGAPYQETAGTPFLVRGPGVPNGLPGDPLVCHLDITATVLDAAGADMGGLDGRSLLGLFAGDAWRERLLVETPPAGWYMLRDGPYAYMELPAGEREMYDLDADPYQLENLLRDPTPEAQATADQLSIRLDKLRNCTGDSCKSAEGP